MGEIREKLQRLEEFLPEQPAAVYEFGRVLAGYLNQDLLPEGFVMAATYAVYDLEKGVHGFTGQPLTGELVGQPKIVYDTLLLMVSHIAEAVCPPDFAARVKEFMGKVEERARKEEEKRKAEFEKVEERVIELGQGNPGGLRVCMQLYQEFGEQALDSLAKLGIRGPDIWILYKDECGENLAAAHKALLENTALAKLQQNPYSSFHQ